jgi:hypothetical protein
MWSFRRGRRSIRRLAVALDREETAIGLTCVAAPILARRSVARTALSMSMPAGVRLTPFDAPAVLAATRAIGRRLGHDLAHAMSPDSLSGPSPNRANRDVCRAQRADMAARPGRYAHVASASR